MSWSLSVGPSRAAAEPRSSPPRSRSARARHVAARRPRRRTPRRPRLARTRSPGRRRLARQRRLRRTISPTSCIDARRHASAAAVRPPASEQPRDAGPPRSTTTAGANSAAGSERQPIDGVDVIVDAGTGEPHRRLIAAADRSLLVTRPCYLALRRADACRGRPTGVVVVDEPGHGAVDPRRRTMLSGCRSCATVSVDPAVARAVDAGLLATRLPRVIGARVAPGRRVTARSITTDDARNVSCGRCADRRRPCAGDVRRDRRRRGPARLAPLDSATTSGASRHGRSPG